MTPFDIGIDDKHLIPETGVEIPSLMGEDDPYALNINQISTS